MFLKKVFHFFSAALNYYYYYFSIFPHKQKEVIEQDYLVQFDANDQKFLSICARSFNYGVDYSGGYRQKEIYTVLLKDCTFLGNSGALVKQNKLVVESVFDALRLTKSNAFRSPAFMLTKNKKGRYTSLMHLPWDESSNYHWFFDSLPRLYSLLQIVKEPIKLILPQNMPAFQRETLSFLLQNNLFFTTEYIGKKEKWQVQEFLFSSFVSNHYSGYLPLPIANLIRERIWQGYKITNSSKKLKVYISRAKAKKRRLLNEVEVEQVLQEFGYRTIYAEDLTYQQQVQLFYDAASVVGVHGAGLTNILFGQELSVMELHPQEMVRSHYFMVCKSLGFSYNYLLGTEANENQDFSVNTAELRNILAKRPVKHS